MRRRPPEQKADTRQQADLRAELISCANRIADHLPAIQWEADHRGWPTNLRQDIPRRRGNFTSVESAAATPDPYSDWLLEFTEARAHMRRCADRAAILDPPKAKRLGRENDIEICALCGDPIGGPIRRIDGQPYHNGPVGSPWCWWRVRRSR